MAKEYVAYTGPVVTRPEARTSGMIHYFTGKVCKNGHIAQRFVSTCSCLVCWRGDGKRYRTLNPTKMRASEKAWKLKNPEKYKAKRKRAYDKNRVAMLASHKRWRDENPIISRASSKNWKQQNPDRHCTNGRNYRSRLRGADGSHTTNEIKALFTKQRGKCVHCHKSLRNGYHVDHIVPLAGGGTNWITNIQLLCGPCNVRKGATDPIEFARRNGRLL